MFIISTEDSSNRMFIYSLPVQLQDHIQLNAKHILVIANGKRNAFKRQHSYISYIHSSFTDI